MTRITPSDQALILLREQLRRLGSERSARAGATERAATRAPLDRALVMAVDSEFSEEEFRRTLVRALLAEQFGDRVAGDSGFQAVVDDVFRIISENEETRELMDRAGRQLRGGR